MRVFLKTVSTIFISTALLFVMGNQNSAFSSGRMARSADQLDSRQGRIVNGTKTLPGYGPWAVIIKVDDKFYCGGSLVDPQLDKQGGVVWNRGTARPQWVITAAHCLYDDHDKRIEKERITILTGTLNRFQTGNPKDGQGAGQEVDVLSIIEHEAYNDNNLKNDIALLAIGSLTDDLHHSRRGSIGLPTAHEYSWINQPYLQTYAFGWGASANSNTQDNLYEVRVPLMDFKTCNQNYAAAGAPLLSGMICAGYSRGEYDSCSGDSGGGLVYRPPLKTSGSGDLNLTILVGVISWGKGCARAGLAGIYSSTLYFETWLNAAFKNCLSLGKLSACDTYSSITTPHKTVSTIKFVSTISGKVVLYPKNCTSDQNIICKLGEPIRFEQNEKFTWQSDAWSGDANKQSGTTDGASIPGWVQGITGDPFDSEFIKAAILHDHYCYKENHVRRWQDVHRMFYDALLIQGVSKFKAKMMYYAVLVGGPRWGKIVPGEDCGEVCSKSRVAKGRKSNTSGWQENQMYSHKDFSTTFTSFQNIFRDEGGFSISEIESMANSDRNALN